MANNQDPTKMRFMYFPANAEGNAYMRQAVHSKPESVNTKIREMSVQSIRTLPE